MKLSAATIIFVCFLALGAALRLGRNIEPDLNGIDHSLMEKDPPIEMLEGEVVTHPRNRCGETDFYCVGFFKGCCYKDGWKCCAHGNDCCRVEVGK